MGERILFVDDEPNLLDGVRRRLNRKFEIETAPSGEAGLLLIKAVGPFAVVVSDLQMPGMSGAEFLCHVRRESPTSVRIVLSGSADLGMLDDGIFRCLSKPCSTETLVLTLEEALCRFRSSPASADTLGLDANHLRA